MSKIRSELSKEIMYTLIDLAKIAGRWVQEPFDPQTIGPGISTKKYRYALYNLEKNNYLQRKNSEGKNFYKLNTKGETYVRKTRLKESISNKKWNGRWYILIFDIPEKKRNYRINLVRALRDIGFYQLQKSVWIFPYDVLDYLYEILPGFREGEWFEYIEVKKISSDEKLKEYFLLD